MFITYHKISRNEMFIIGLVEEHIFAVIPVVRKLLKVPVRTNSMLST